MNKIAKEALQRARLRMAGQPKNRPTSPGTKISVPFSEARSTGVLITGPINHFMFLEGRAWAVDLVSSLRASPPSVVIERLTGAAQDRPSSYVAGIQSVIDAIKDGDATVSMHTPNLTRQE